MIALMGESGKGKSTLLQLIQRFYLPESGVICVNSIPINKIGMTDWRASVGSVPQEPKIFNGTLIYNIALSTDLSVQKEAVQFCKQRKLDDYFSAFPSGYSTLIGEEGIAISGGQKQLVVLARALFLKPKILLLDEATAAMDNTTEDFVMDLLQKENVNMAILLVTHRDRTAKRCQESFILVNGHTQRIS